MENLNLVEILKGCPAGTPLYSPIFGEVELLNACEPGSCYPIKVKATETNGDTEVSMFTTEGKYWDNYANDECLLFPSKDCRDWSQFRKHEFKPFDRVLVRVRNSEKWRVGFFDREEKNNEERNYYVIGLPYYFAQCLPYEGNEHLKDSTETLQQG